MRTKAMGGFGVGAAALCILLASRPAAASTPPPPRVYFSDLSSGPKTGNGDTSQGQTAGVDGALVTIWGIFGDSTSKPEVYCNGAQAATVYYHGDAVAPYSPANLYNGYTKTQVLVFQVSHLAQDGAGEIHVTVDGTTSNSIPFTVETGRIYFVKTTGNDSTGDGSWTNPWATMPEARSKLAPGDIAYVGDGVSQTTPDPFYSDSAVHLGSEGTASSPQALVAYPGASVTVGTTNLEAFRTWYSGMNRNTNYWTIAKFNIVGQVSPVTLNDGYRVVGNKISAPNGDGATGTVSNGGSCGAPSNNLFVLGNELTNCGAATSSKLYHVIYVSGARCSTAPRAPTESGREIGWNYIHDNNATNAINIYSEGTYSAYISGHRVHDNVIVNQAGKGIMMGYYVTGDNWIYNNLILHAGLGPLPPTSWDHACIGLEAGVETVPASGTTLYVFNNTLYGCGVPGSTQGTCPGPQGSQGTSKGTSGYFSIWRTNMYTLQLENNAVMSTGEPYIACESDAILASPTISNNLWYGLGPAPAWDTDSINMDPLFANPGSDFRLQSGSPAIDHGLSVGSVVPTDVDGIARPQGPGFDVGAYEYCQSGACAAPPPTPDGGPPGGSDAGSGTDAATTSNDGGETSSGGTGCGCVVQGEPRRTSRDATTSALAITCALFLSRRRNSRS